MLDRITINIPHCLQFLVPPASELLHSQCIKYGFTYFCRKYSQNRQCRVILFTTVKKSQVPWERVSHSQRIYDSPPFLQIFVLQGHTGSFSENEKLFFFIYDQCNTREIRVVQRPILLAK